MSGFDLRWETDVYSAGRQLNLYPSEIVVGLIFRLFASVPDKSSLRILDLGCGAGNNTRFLASLGCQVDAIDGSSSAVAVAKKRLAADGLSAEVVVGDFRSLPYDDARFDCVIDRGSVTHNRRADIEATFAEVQRVLKPGGVFFSQMFSTAHRDRAYGTPLGDGSYDAFTDGYFADIALTFFASEEDIVELFFDGFEILSSVQVLEIPAGKTAASSAIWNTTARKRV